jgi:hypothetical protein
MCPVTVHWEPCTRDYCQRNLLYFVMRSKTAQRCVHSALYVLRTKRRHLFPVAIFKYPITEQPRRRPAYYRQSHTQFQPKIADCKSRTGSSPLRSRMSGLTLKRCCSRHKPGIERRKVGFQRTEDKHDPIERVDIKLRFRLCAAIVLIGIVSFLPTRGCSKQWPKQIATTRRNQQLSCPPPPPTTIMPKTNRMAPTTVAMAS